MAVPFSNTKLRAPRGFRNVLEGLSREILRSQPSDIYAFGSLYFEKLLQIRAESGVDPVDFGAHEEDRSYNDKSYATATVKHESTPDKEKAALKIQTKYRQHTAKKVVRGMREEKAAVKIQSVFRGHLDRKHIQCVKHDADTDETEAYKLAREEDAEEEEREGDSPSKIMLKDYPDRKEIDKLQAVVTEREAAALAKELAEQQQKEKEMMEEEEEEEPEEMSELEDAATRIQAGMRGLLTRLSLKQGIQSAGAQGESAPVEQPKEKIGEEEEEEEEEEMNDVEDVETQIKASQSGKDEGDGQGEESGTKEGEPESETKEGETEETETKEGETEEFGTKEGNEETDAENKAE